MSRLCLCAFVTLNKKITYRLLDKHENIVLQIVHARRPNSMKTKDLTRTESSVPRSGPRTQSSKAKTGPRTKICLKDNQGPRPRTASLLIMWLVLNTVVWPLVVHVRGNVGALLIGDAFTLLRASCRNPDVSLTDSHNAGFRAPLNAAI